MEEEEISALLEKVKSEVTRVIEPIKKGVEEQGIALQRLKIGDVPGGNAIAKILETKKKDFQSVLDGTARSVKFTVPAESVKTLVQSSSVANSTLAHRLPDVGQVATINPVLRSLFRQASVSPGQGGVVRYFDQVASGITRGAAMTSEGSQKQESKIEWEEKSMILRKVADSIPVTKEALEDFPFMQTEIERLLSQNLALKTDSQVWNGDGVAPNLQGIFDLASDFTSIIDAIITGEAGDVASVATYDGGAKALITFTDPQALYNGDSITFANATHTGYNATFKALVLSPTQIVIDVAFVTEADTSAWTFTTASRFKATVATPNFYDLVLVVKSAIMAEQDGKFMPNTVIVNPIDMIKFKLAKGNDEHYLLPELVTADLALSGMTVVESGQVRPGTALVGDFRFGTLYSMGGVEIQVGWVNDQFIKNSMTILAEERLGLLVRSVDTAAFLKITDISGALTSLASA